MRTNILNYIQVSTTHVVLSIKKLNYTRKEYTDLSTS